MSLFEKYAIKDDEMVFVNFIENQFQVKEFNTLISKEYTDKFVIEFKPTDNCNFNCSYCCFHDNSSKHLSDENFEKYLEVLRNINTQKKEVFLFVYGGEPTMHPKLTELVIRINELYKDKKIKTLIQSNGMKWEIEDYKKNHEELSSRNIEYVFSFSYHDEFAKLSSLLPRIKYLLSVNCFDVLTYMITRNKIEQHIQNIKTLNATSIPLYVRTILQESEWFLTSEYKQYVTYKPDKTPFILTDNSGTKTYSFEDLTMNGYLNFKGYQCSSGDNVILMASNGRIYRCDMDFLYDRDCMYDVNISTTLLWEESKCTNCTHKFCSIYYGDKWKN